MIESTILARVASLPAVVAVVGARVYLDQLPQSPTYPAVRVQRISDPIGGPADNYHLRGPIGCRAARIQVDGYARSSNTGSDPYTQVRALMDAIDGDGRGRVASGLDGWIGAAGSPPVDVAGIFVVQRTNRWDPEELQIVTMSTDYVVWFRG